MRASLSHAALGELHRSYAPTVRARQCLMTPAGVLFSFGASGRAAIGQKEFFQNVDEHEKNLPHLTASNRLGKSDAVRCEVTNGR